jgi:3-dehydroquinate synthase
MNIRTSQGSYDITFVDSINALNQAAENAIWITDDNLMAHYPWLVDRHAIAVEPGEGSKDLRTFGELLEGLAMRGATRKTPIVAFGGGVVGDLAGFVAASYMRGVPFIQIPTSLLAMVDSSVGGKVGIDLKAGKNLAGAFKAPQEVLICPDLLKTLPEREFWNGMAEVLKYALIMDADLFENLTNHPIQIGDKRVPDVIQTCIAHKAKVVQQDEFETTGLRAILNFGHTVGHAIEAEMGYQEWLHGEAIAVGMVAEASIGETLGFTKAGTTIQVQNLMASHNLPTQLPKNIDIEALMHRMSRDKKRTESGLALSLLTDIGTCKLQSSVDPERVQQAMYEWVEASRVDERPRD